MRASGLRRIDPHPICAALKRPVMGQASRGQRASPRWATVTVLAVLCAAPQCVRAQNVWKYEQCTTSHAFNKTYSKSYGIPGNVGYKSGIDFYFATGTEEPADWGQSFGRYDFGDIQDDYGQYTLQGAYIDVSDCKAVGTVVAPGDTSWAGDLYVESGSGGTVTPIYRADTGTCDGAQEIYYDPNDPPPECVGGGGGGPNNQVEVCEYIVAADAYGNPILDDNGNFIVLEDLGCWYQ
jgi:hypothetical protein